MPRYQIWVGKTTDTCTIDFPIPNEYFDETAIQVLRTAFETLQARRPVERPGRPLPPPGRCGPDAGRRGLPAALLELTSYWWNDDKDEAIAEFTRVAEASRPESDLRLDLAELLEQQGERADAMALADAVQPLDNATMKRREELALRYRRPDRQPGPRPPGRRAALRPAAGYRHPGPPRRPDAPARAARAGRGRPGPRPTPRRQQGRRPGRHDAPVPAAGQARRRRPGGHADPPLDHRDPPGEPERLQCRRPRRRRVRPPSASSPDPAGCPSSSTRPTSSSRRPPTPIQLRQALADYYKAAGKRDEARAELARIVSLRPDDANLRLQVAQQLAQDGQAEAAIEHYKVILKNDPSLLSRYFYQVKNAFQQANKTEELLGLVEHLDLRQLGHPYYIMSLITGVLTDEKLHDRAMPLLRKAWDAFPDYRSYLFSDTDNEQIWKYPEIYEYARDSVVPRPETFSAPLQWEPFDTTLSSGQNGRTTTVVSRMLDMAASQGRLEELSAQVDAIRKALPNWTAGDVVRAMVDCRLGRFDQAQAVDPSLPRPDPGRDTLDQRLRGRRRRARGPRPDPRPGPGPV